MGIASLIFGVISIGVGLIAFGYQFLGIVQNLFYLTIVGIFSGIGLFIVGGLLLSKYDEDRKKEKGLGNHDKFIEDGTTYKKV